MIFAQMNQVEEISEFDDMLSIILLCQNKDIERSSNFASCFDA